MHAKMMSGGFNDDDWPSEVSNVCDKSTCYEEKYGSKDTWSECCYGHFDSLKYNCVDNSFAFAY